MAPLLSLPNEIILNISEFLHEDGLLQLCRVNRRLHEVADRALMTLMANKYPYLLCWACEFNEIELVERLLSVGADPNKPFVLQWRFMKRREVPCANKTDKTMVLTAVYGHQAFLYKVRNQRRSWQTRDEEVEDEEMAPDAESEYESEGVDQVEEEDDADPDLYLDPDLEDEEESEEDQDEDEDEEEEDEDEDEDEGDGQDEKDRQDDSRSGNESSYQLEDSYHPDKYEQFLPLSKGYCYWFPLHAAANSGHHSLVQLLVGHGAFIDVPSSFFCACSDYNLHQHQGPHARRLCLRTPLHTALCGGRESTAYLLLTLGASIYVDLNNTLGPNALHVASAHDCLSVVKLLVEGSYKIGVDVRDDANLTPLWHACSGRGAQRETASVVGRWLLYKGAQVDADLGDGCTVLHLACHRAWYVDAMQLIELSANVNARWNSGANVVVRPLDLCCGRRVMRPTNHEGFDIPLVAKQEARLEQDNTNLIRKLIGAGADVHPNPSCPHSPLTYAASYGRVKMIELLLDAGAQIDQTDASGYTPLFALISGNVGRSTENTVEAVELLLRRGARVHAKIASGETVYDAISLRHHASKDLKAITVALLKHGLDPNLVDDSGVSAFRLLYYHGLSGICQELVEHGGHVSPSDLKYLFEDLVRQATDTRDRSVNYVLRGNTTHHQWAWRYTGKLITLLKFDKDKTLLADPKVLWLVTSSALFLFTDILFEFGDPDVSHVSEALLPIGIKQQTCLHSVIIWGDDGSHLNYRVNLLRRFISLGTDVNTGTPVLQAINVREYTLATVLLQNGATVPLPPRDDLDAFDALWKATIDRAPFWCIGIILDNLEAPLNNETSPHYLIEACHYTTHPQLVSKFIQAGAAADRQDGQERTALSAVLAQGWERNYREDAANGVVDIIKVLLDNGASLRDESEKVCLEKVLSETRRYSTREPTVVELEGQIEHIKIRTASTGQAGA